MFTPSLRLGEIEWFVRQCLLAVAGVARGGGVDGRNHLPLCSLTPKPKCIEIIKNLYILRNKHFEVAEIRGKTRWGALTPFENS